MGDGKNLKRILKEKGMNVRKAALSAQISPSTLYTIVQRDGKLRLDLAFKLSNTLDINIQELITVPAYYSIDEFSETTLENHILQDYCTKVLMPLIKLYGNNSRSEIDFLLTAFYQLDDTARKNMLEILRLNLKSYKDEKRCDQLKQL